MSPHVRHVGLDEERAAEERLEVLERDLAIAEGRNDDARRAHLGEIRAPPELPRGRTRPQRLANAAALIGDGLVGVANAEPAGEGDRAPPSTT